MDFFERAKLHHHSAAIAEAVRSSNNASARDYLAAVQCLAATGNRSESIERAAEIYGQNSRVLQFLQRDVIGSQQVAAEDPEFSVAMHDFLALVEKRSLVGRINALSPFRRTGFHERTLVQTERPQATWVREGDEAPLGDAKFTLESLDTKKLVILSLLTKEAASGKFEGVFSRDLTGSIALGEGQAFIDPGNTGDASTPASVTSGAPTIPSSGPAATNIRTDIRALFEAFDGDLESAVLVANPQTLLALSLMQDSLGQSGLNIRGGELFGVPVIGSDSVPMDSSGGTVALVDPAGILLADEGISIRRSEAGMVNVDDAAFSLFQQNLIGLLSFRRLNWKVVRPGSAASLTNVNWGD